MCQLPSLCSLLLSAKANGMNIDVVDNTVCQNFRVIRVTLQTRLACVMVGERSPLYVRLCVYVTMAAESTTTTAEPTTTETTTGARTTTTPTPSGTVIFITAPW